MPFGIVVDAPLIAPGNAASGIADLGHKRIHAKLQFFVIAAQATVLDRVTGPCSTAMEDCQQ
jgi:hypothetical protein